MKLVHMLAAAACLVTSIPLFAGRPATASGQEPATAPQTQSAPQSEPQTTPQTSPQAEPPAQPETASPTASAGSSPDAAMKAVNCELVEKLDSKTAKTGDSVVVKTRSAIKTADGTEIPKGTKLMGHITAVKASGDAHENSEVALAFDTAQLKGGQTVPIHSEIQSLSPAGGSSSNDTTASMGAGSAPTGPAASGSAPSGAMQHGSAGTATAGSAGSASETPSSPSASSAPSQPMQSTGPAPGTVVATTGNIAIRATAIPGVMLAGNQPGQKDPRMGQSSGILLGAKRDIQLDGGTELVLNVAPGTTGGTR